MASPKSTKRRKKASKHFKHGLPPQNQEREPDNETLRDAIVRAHGRIGIVARALQLDRSTIYKRIQKHRMLRRAVNESRNYVVEFAEYKLFQKVQDGDLRAIIFVLQNLGKKKGWGGETDQDKAQNLEATIAAFEKALAETKPAALPEPKAVIDIIANGKQSSDR